MSAAVVDAGGSVGVDTRHSGLAFRPLLPRAVEIVEATDEQGVGPLLRSEKRAIAAAIPKRRIEFARGRTCARAALRKLTGAEHAIPQAGSRAPVWPDGVTGSITHCAGLTASAVARKSAVLALGIDAESMDGALPAGVADLFCTPPEAAWVRTQHDADIAAKLIFCAKEAVFKCLHPYTGVWLDPGDVVVSVQDDGCFAADVFCGPVTSVGGRWALRRRHVCAVAVLKP